MRIAITGGTGFIGRNIAQALAAAGHETVLISRGVDRTDPEIRALPGAQFVPIGIDDPDLLAKAFAGCDAVAHCAGINREIGTQTYQRVHVEGTRNVTEAARRAGVARIAIISFLRARPNCGSGYHESKWAAEEIVRSSGLDYTVFKCGVIYGRGDHMLDHLSRAFHTFPLFAFVGFHDRAIRPVAVEDLVRLVNAAIVAGACSRQTVTVLGPEELTLQHAVKRVAKVVGRKPLMFSLPVAFHYLLGGVLERIMKVPLVSTAQVRILSEGVTEPWGEQVRPPAEWAPQSRFSESRIREGLPVNIRSFGCDDLRMCRTCTP